jgi:hypothetical protein
MTVEEKNISCLNSLIDEKLKLGTEIDELVKMISKADDGSFKASLNTLKENFISKNSVNSETVSFKDPNSKTEAVVQMADSLEKEFAGFKEASLNDKTLSDLKQKLLHFINDPGNKISNNSNANNISDDIKYDKMMDYLKFVTKDINIDAPTQRLLENIVNIAIKRVHDDVDLSKDFTLKKTVDIANDISTSEAEDISEKFFEKCFKKIDQEAVKKDADMDINKTYKDMFEKLETIKNVLDHSNLPNREDILNKIDNLQNNLKFLNELNNHSTYIQIPINIANKNTTAELYILKRDCKKKKIDPQDTTIFLSLNTQKLGRVDTLIAVNKRDIRLNIRVEKEEIIGFVKKSYKHLYNGLNQKGYKLVDVKCRLSNEDINLLNIKEVLNKEFEIKRQAIDCKI